MLGRRGRVREWRGAQGKVDIQSEIWNAVGDAALSPGDPVVVVEISGLSLKVKPLQEQP